MKKKIVFLLGSLLAIAGCQTGANQNEYLQTANQSNSDPYAAVREYEQTHGLFDWRTAPPVT